jgi:hemoglobin/transferrin/lactoferrin receptor protein
MRSFNDRVTLSATGFYTWYQNAITTLPSTFNGNDSLFFDGQNSKVYSSANANKAYIYGANFAINASITDNFSINHSTNYTFGRITTNIDEIPLDHIAPIFGRTSFVYQQLKLRAEFFAMYNGAKKSKDYNPFGEDNQAFSADPINGYTPAWMTLNIRTGYQINKRLQLMLAVENITDLNYRVYASNISAAGRNFVFTMRGTL